MIKKAILVAMLLAFTIPFLSILAINNMRYDAYESKTKIFFNNNEVVFDSPVVTINGLTYVPLREATQKANIEIEWDGEENKIILTGNSDCNPYKMFNEVFEFKLPDTADVTDYNCFIDEFGVMNFVAKIVFDKKDLEYIENNISGNFSISPNSLGIAKNSAIGVLTKESGRYEWWELSDINEVLSLYNGYKTSQQMKSMPVWAFVTTNLEGRYYLYVFCIGAV